MTETTMFTPMPKIPRFNREVIITEKIDGTNAAVLVHHDGLVQACSKNLILEDHLPDNHGFRAWVREHADELRELGPGLHRGEWWGVGIGKRYPGLPKRFSLFNVSRWGNQIHGAKPPPACVGVVPVLGVCEFMNTPRVLGIVHTLRGLGSTAAPGHKAEGVVIYHTASGALFKVTCEKDDEHKAGGGA